MLDAFLHINWIAVAIAVISHFILGGLWFGGLFSMQYAQSLGIADRPRERPKTINLLGPLVCGAFTIVTTAFLLRVLNIQTYPDALALGAVVGVGYLCAMTTNIAINPLFPHPLHYALVNAPMFLIGSLVSCTILTALP